MTVGVGGCACRFSLEQRLKSSNFAGKASRVEAFLNVGAGTGRTTATVTASASGTTTTTEQSAAKFAYSAGGGFDIKLSDTVTLRPLDLKYIRASMLTNGGQVIGNHMQFAAGLGLRF